MTAIVLQLQADALDRTIPIADLLRKALVVAKKLGVSEFSAWLAHELGGYPDQDTVPPYRNVRGEVQIFNPYQGWRPLSLANSKQHEVLSTRLCDQSVAELQSLLDDRQDDSILIMKFSPEVEKQLMQGMRPVSLQPGLRVPHAALVGILDTVRTAVLNWALKLEEDGILGENLSFSDHERNHAASSSYHVNNFYAPISQSQFAQGASQPVQVAISKPVDIAQLAALLAKVRSETSTLNLPQDQRDELNAELSTVESQLKSPRPKVDVVKGSLLSIKTILEGAAGGALGQLLLELAKAAM